MVRTFTLQIYYQSHCDKTVKVIDIPDNITTFTITGLISSTNYTVYLSAFTGAGEGDFSVNITYTTVSVGKMNLTSM